VLGLLIGTIHLLLMLNACVRSIAGKWVLGGIAGAARITLLVAITMAGSRIRVSGAAPTPAFAVGLYAGPALTVLALALAFRRRSNMPAGSDAEATAESIVRAWLAATIIDLMFVVVNVAARIINAPTP
jgi:hypothetical protein